MKTRWAAAILLGGFLAAPAATWGKKHSSAVPATKATPPEEALRNYIARVRAQQAAEVHTAGSLWSPDGQLVRLGTDVKAYRIHDVVMIVVGESLSASTGGQVKNCLLYTSPSPRDISGSRMPSSA